MNHTSNPTIQTGQRTPERVMPAYYLGRPNVVYLERYTTSVEPLTSTPA